MPQYHQPEIETMPRDELRALQLERMRESMRNAYDNVAVFRERFDEARSEEHTSELQSPS